MTSPKDSLAALASRLGITELAARRATKHLAVFGFHRIRPDDAGFTTPFDDDVYGPTVQVFCEQMRWLKRRRRILSESELIALAYSENAPIPSSCAVVTFDDAYRDTYTRALPVLEQLKVPAVLFVPTGLIKNRQLGWWDLIAYFMKHSRKTSITLNGIAYPLGRQRNEASARLLNLMKLEKAHTTQGLMDELSEACEVPFPADDLQDEQLMTWEQIRDWAARGLTIASHTHTHRVLKTLEDVELVEELRLSKHLLEKQTQCEIRTLAYPCGAYEHFDNRVQRQVSAEGYRLGFSYNTGVNHGNRLPPFDVKRVGVSNSLARFKAIATFPQIFSFS